MYMLSPSPRTLILVCGLAIAGVGCHRIAPKEHARRGDTYFEEGRVQEAIVEYRVALQGDPKLGEARLKLGEAYLRVNDPKNALRELVRASDLLPKSVDAQV